MQRLVTHSGKFHADDAFATAVLKRYFNNDVEVIRSRDEAVLASGDVVYDVGRVYDPAVNRFDHHQAEGAGTRENGVPYAAFGLIWKHFGKKLVSSDAVWQKIDEHLVQTVDAIDVGYVSSSVEKVKDFGHYTLDSVANAFNVAWDESYAASDELFMELVSFAERILDREMVRAEAAERARVRVEACYAAAIDKKIIILDTRYPWREALVQYPEPQFVIYPEIDTNRWMVQTMYVTKAGYESRIKFPEAWRGLTETALATASGVADARFCHNAGFLAVVDTKEGAITLAQKAIAAA